MTFQTIINAVSALIKPVNYQTSRRPGVFGVGSKNQIETQRESGILHGALIMGDYDRAKEARGKLDSLYKTRNREIF